MCMSDKSSKPTPDELTTIVKLLTEIERKQAVMQSDVQDIKRSTKMNELTISNTQSSLKEQGGRLRMIEEDIRAVAVSQEVTETKLDQILEALTPELEKITDNTLRIENHETQIVQHNIRLSALENAA
jgi:chromosome segregation ATPase